MYQKLCRDAHVLVETLTVPDISVYVCSEWVSCSAYMVHRCMYNIDGLTPHTNLHGSILMTSLLQYSSRQTAQLSTSCEPCNRHNGNTSNTHTNTTVQLSVVRLEY